MFIIQWIEKMHGETLKYRLVIWKWLIRLVIYALLVQKYVDLTCTGLRSSFIIIQAMAIMRGNHSIKRRHHMAPGWFPPPPSCRTRKHTHTHTHTHTHKSFGVFKEPQQHMNCALTRKIYNNTRICLISYLLAKYYYMWCMCDRSSYIKMTRGTTLCNNCNILS